MDAFFSENRSRQKISLNEKFEKIRPKYPKAPTAVKRLRIL